MRPVFKIILVYEVGFFLFWNFIYYTSSDIENWFEEKILAAIYVVLTTMALGFVLVYVIYISMKLTGILDRIVTIKDPRKNK
jgi:heme/copper-type cytochrome/quinol oxidase subunit 1